MCVKMVEVGGGKMVKTLLPRIAILDLFLQPVVTRLPRHPQKSVLTLWAHTLTQHYRMTARPAVMRGHGIIHCCRAVMMLRVVVMDLHVDAC